MNTDSSVRTFENDLKMMQYFQEEFMFRHNHYWNTLMRFFILSIVITILPITSEVLGITLNSISPKYLFFFPILGLVVSLLSLIILRKEAKKLKAVNDAKYRINRQNMEPMYHYEFYNSSVGFDTSNRKKWLSFQMPWFVFSLEIAIILCVCIVII